MDLLGGGFSSVGARCLTKDCCVAGRDFTETKDFSVFECF